MDRCLETPSRRVMIALLLSARARGRASTGARIRDTGRRPSVARLPTSTDRGARPWLNEGTLASREHPRRAGGEELLGAGTSVNSGLRRAPARSRCQLVAAPARDARRRSPARACRSARPLRARFDARCRHAHRVGEPAPPPSGCPQLSVSRRLSGSGDARPRPPGPRRQVDGGRELPPMISRERARQRPRLRLRPPTGAAPRWRSHAGGTVTVVGTSSSPRTPPRHGLRWA